MSKLAPPKYKLEDVREELFVSSNLQDKHSKETQVIRDVKLLGAKSRNGRTYTPKAIAEAADRYEGVQVNVDHPSMKDIKKDRGLLESFGEVRNTRHDAKGAYGDIHYLKSHHATPVVMERLEKKMKMGLSHNARTLSRRDDSGESIIEGVPLVRSVDLVLNPATTENMFESIEVVEENDGLKDTIEALLSDETLTDEQVIEGLSKIPEVAAVLGDTLESQVVKDLNDKIEKLNDQVESLQVTDSLEEFCRENGGNLASLPKSHKDILESVDPGDRLAIWNTWPKSVRGHEKPKVKHVLESNVDENEPGSKPLA